MSKVIIITGSPSPASRLTGVLQEVERRLAERGISADWLHVSELPPDVLIGAKFDSPVVEEANRRVAAADAVIVASPVFKASYSGILKSYLDLLPRDAFADKPVLPIFIGGSISNLLVIDYALKPVLSALGARLLLAGAYAVDTQVVRTGEGTFTLDEELTARLAKTADALANVLQPVTASA
jgi:FMN reductase